MHIISVGGNMETAEIIVSRINSVVWGPAMLCMLLFIGIFYTVKINFFQFVHFRTWLKETIGSCFSKKDRTKCTLSPFKAMTTALAGAIGTGNIVGVAGAIALGGAGAVFWMWVAAFFGMATVFAENYLGIIFRENRNGEYVGGPMYYIEKGLHSKVLAAIFAIMCTGASLGMGNMTQANSAAGAMNIGFGIDVRISGAVIAALTALIIFGGIDRISALNEKLIPVVSLLFILFALLILLFNHERIIPSVIDIIKNAFGFRQAAGGFCGYTMANALRYGISRGVFSNEAGLGSSPIVHSASDNTTPVKAGMWGIFQVFVDTIIMCTLMALCIMVTGSNEIRSNAVEISSAAFSSVFAGAGSFFVNASITVFAFATLISWCYYGEKSIQYLFQGKYITVYRIIYISAAFIGSVMEIGIVWDISDTFNGLMAIPNMIALLLLSRNVSYKKFNNHNRNI